MIAALENPLAFSKAFRDWVREGLSYGLPTKAAELFYRPTHLLRMLDADHTVAKTYSVEQSFLGKRKLEAIDENTAAERTLLCLAPNHYHRLQLVLPASSGGRLALAVELKLSAASPILLKDASYDFKKVGRDAKRRLLVDVVLCRKKTIVAVLNAVQITDAAISIVACPDDQPSDLFILHREKPRQSRFRISAPIVMGFAITALMLAVTGMQSYLEKQTAAYEQYERKLISSLKVKKKDLETLGEQVAAANGRYAYYAPQDITGALRGTFKALPPGFVVTDISVEENVLTVSGLSLIEAREQVQERFDASHFIRSDRPGFEHVRLTIMMENAS